MRGGFDSTLPWWVAGPALGLVFVSLLGLAGQRFGVLGGVTDLVGARPLRGRRALLTGVRIDWRPTRPTARHIVGSVLFGVGWGISKACPEPIAAQLGSGRLFVPALAAGVLVGVRLQSVLVHAADPARVGRSTRREETPVPAIAAAEVL
jgi:uncharacterized membrane protein YedE/YeeE